MGADRGIGDALEVRVGGGQVREHRDRHQYQGDDGRDEEAAVDRRHAAAVGAARRHREDPDHRGEHADRGDQQREGQPGVAEGDLAEDEGGHEGHGVGLEEVRRHARAVADVVAHVVRDGGGVARVILGDALFDLADEVRADVRGLGEDAAADAHEHRQQRGPEAEALQDLGRVGRVDEYYAGRAEQAQPHGEHADDAARAESDLRGLVRDLGEVLGRPALGWRRLTGGRRDPHIAAHREPHADIAGRRREESADQEKDRASDAL